MEAGKDLAKPAAGEIAEMSMIDHAATDSKEWQHAEREGPGPLSAARILPALASYKAHGGFFGRQVVLYVSPERFISGKLRRNRSIPDEALEPGENHGQLLRKLNKTREFSLADILKVELFGGSTYFALSKFNFWTGHVLRVTARDDEFNWLVPSDVAEIMEEGFNAAKPNLLKKIPEAPPVEYRPVLLRLITFAAVIIILGFLIEVCRSNGSIQMKDQAYKGIIVCLIAGALMFPPLEKRLLYNLAHWPVPSGKSKVKRDLSDRVPFSMPVLGTTIKYGAGLIFIGVYLWLFIFPPLVAPNIILALFAMAIIYWCLASLVHLGERLSLVPAEPSAGKHWDAPILFLRAFDDDGKGSYNPTGVAPKILGLRTTRYIVNYHPVRVGRTLLNRQADTAEEQMAGYMAEIGPFVAMGKPGQRMAFRGAARIYVAEGHWRETVLDLLSRSQIVVMQPAETSGVWWEVERILERIPCTKVLLTLVNFVGKPNRYTLFRWRFEQLTGRELPRAMGDALFCYFQEGWKPQMLPGRYYTPFIWPLVSCGLNFKKTLRPFFDGIEGHPATDPPPRDNRGLRWIQCALAIIIFCGLIFEFGELQVFVIREGCEWRVARQSAKAEAVSTYSNHPIGTDYMWHLSDAWSKDASGAYFIKADGVAMAGVSFSIEQRPDSYSYQQTMEARIAEIQGALENAAGRASVPLGSTVIRDGVRAWIQKKFVITDENSWFAYAPPKVYTVATAIDGDKLITFVGFGIQLGGSGFADLIDKARQGLIRR